MMNLQDNIYQFIIYIHTWSAIIYNLDDGFKIYFLMLDVCPRSQSGWHIYLFWDITLNLILIKLGHLFHSCCIGIHKLSNKLIRWWYIFSRVEILQEKWVLGMAISDGRSAVTNKYFYQWQLVMVILSS